MLRRELPEYDKAMVRFIGESILGFMELHPLFGLMPHTVTDHRGPVRNVRGERPLDQTLAQVGATLEVSWNTVRNTDVDSFAEALHALAQEHVAELSKAFFQALEEITSATGNVGDAGGQPFSFDMYIEMLQRIDIVFDCSGRPQLPTLVVSPAFRVPEMTPEQKEAFSQVIEKKRVEFHASKGARRLS